MPGGGSNGWAHVVAGVPVKLVCSCVRNGPERLRDAELAVEHQQPRDGDLVIVRCLDSTGAYDHVEDSAGAPVKLYRGDELVVLLGTRRSGTNLFGELPAGPIGAGSKLDLVAQGGLAAECVAVPAYYGSRALPLEVVGFPAVGGRTLNIADQPVIPVPPAEPAVPAAAVVFVCGTSAEVGKTTMVCSLNIAVKRRLPGIRTAAIKACGTGRAKDCLHYRAANYDVVTDFVDAGMASTYGVARKEFRAMLTTLIAHCAERAELVVVEIGGDFLEACAPEALEIMAELDASCVMMVNDAMGAAEGLRQLDRLGREPLAIGTFKQNRAALADRLGIDADRVVGSDDAEVLPGLIARLLSPVRAGA
ncbi:hypothetical protein [Amycolatopsis sp. YIM 10]|uniref:hypothetical protein n=1 Tax=Amycolatopsis sp. YIM 10 TaxID=2653857 RepID=UPI00129083BA|nr:hypothetical protein [Amycolatopsis sp. YIM 10]QFU91059.1 hypothetical protein YIM_29465 [Amycolatopsis sp. YIM 10]